MAVACIFASSAMRKVLIMKQKLVTPVASCNRISVFNKMRDLLSPCKQVLMCAECDSINAPLKPVSINK